MPDAPSPSRDVLPIAPGAAGPPRAVDIRDQDPSFTPPSDVTAPAGAPNVVVILLDDMGFGAASAFGGPCDMPAADRLAEDGLRFTRFHTTAICSSTRAALLTGRNHHSVGVGTAVDVATAAPGYTGRMPRSAATIARVLTHNGYATGAFGKMHETPRQEVTPVGPFDRWPTVGEGFQRFYGFMAAEINHWAPALYDGTTAIDPPARPEEGYHLSEDLVDKAIDWVRDVRAVSPARPFFCYLPFGATHSPFHVHREWIERYRGRFDHGWDEQRVRTLARQKELGVVPTDTELAPWPEGLVPRWDELDDTQRRAASALMEVYAAFAEHTDTQVGRFVDALEELGELDDTLILYVLGDNGASGEGTPTGLRTGNYGIWSGVQETVEDIVADIDRLGGPETWPHYPTGWALAMDTPYQWIKQIASHYGGTRNGLIVHWPTGIEEAGGLRHQFHHVIDVAPTILEAAGLPAPRIVDGVEQQPVEGSSMLYTFNDADARDRHRTQYFEIGGSRAIYHDGWVACTVHRPAPWLAVTLDLPAFADDRWELYDTTTDWSQARDVSAEHPDKLRELQQLFLIEAARCQVLPLDDRPLAARRDATEERGADITTMTFHTHTRRMPLDAMPNVLNHSHAITAMIDVPDRPDAPARGVVCAQGGRFCGWSLYCRDGRPAYCHNAGGRVRYYVASTEPLSPGRHELRYEFEYDGGGLGRGGNGRLFVDGEKVAEGRIEHTASFVFQLGEYFNVGVDPLSPVTDEYPAVDNAFNGVVRTVRIDVGDGDQPSAADRLRAELATH